MRIENFQDYLENDLAWRKKEISQLFMIFQSVENKDVIGKSLILLLYAHWEGFIKKSSKYYLEYVSDKNIILNQLTINFEAIMLKKYARECIYNDSNNLAKEFDFMNAQQKRNNRPFYIKKTSNNEFDNSIIDTQHNLSSKVLKNIIQIIGIVFNESMQARTTFLDANLLNIRHTIGHGSQLKISDGEMSPLDNKRITEVKEFVVLMLDYYAEVLLKYVDDELYLISNSEKRESFEISQNEKLAKKLSIIAHK